MAPKLYSLSASPAVRAVLITAEAIGLELDVHEVDWEKGELMSPAYLKMNPQHTVPTLDDNGTIMWDSHAINIYLVEKNGKNELFYPKDFRKRAIVNQRLFFEAGVLYPALVDVDLGMLKKEIKEVQPKQVEKIKIGYDFLETFLKDRIWAIGDHPTLADFSLMPTVTSLDVHVPIDPKTYPYITAWLQRVQSLPCCAHDQKNLQDFKDFIKFIKS